MELILIGVITALNFIVVKMKIERKRYEDAFFDVTLMAIMAFLFSGSYAGMVVAMVASISVSVYLLFSPPKFTSGLRTKLEGKVKEINKLNGLDDKDIFKL